MHKRSPEAQCWFYRYYSIIGFIQESQLYHLEREFEINPFKNCTVIRQQFSRWYVTTKPVLSELVSSFRRFALPDR